jgi:hypothetical protein
MSETPSDPKSIIQRNRKTLERLRQVAQEADPHPDRRRYIRTLGERLEYLERKISSHECSPAAESRYRSERKALAWALAELGRSYPHLLEEPPGTAPGNQ